MTPTQGARFQRGACYGGKQGAISAVLLARTVHAHCTSSNCATAPNGMFSACFLATGLLSSLLGITTCCATSVRTQPTAVSALQKSGGATPIQQGGVPPRRRYAGPSREQAPEPARTAQWFHGWSSARGAGAHLAVQSPARLRPLRGDERVQRGAGDGERLPPPHDRSARALKHALLNTTGTRARDGAASSRACGGAL